MSSALATRHRLAVLVGVLTGLLLVSGGCAVGPDHVMPERNTSASWDLGLEKGLDDRKADLSRWWSRFDDPTLVVLVETAVQNNNDLRQAASRVREARFQRGVVAGDYGPSLDLGGSAERSRRSSNSFQGFISGDRNLFSVGFDATWELDVFGRVRRGVEAADADLESAAADLHDVMVSLIAEVARNYVELRSLQRRLEIADSNARAQSSTLDLTRSRSDAGLTSELDVAQAQANLATTRSAIPPLQAAVVEATSRLAVLLGIDPGRLDDEIEGIRASAPVPLAPATIAIGLPADLLRRRPDIRRAERDVAAAAARVGIATAELYPQFTLTGSIGLESEDADNLFESGSRRYGFGPALRWNLFAWGRLRAAIHAAEERHEQTLAGYEQAVLLALEEARNAIAAFTKEQDRRAALLAGETASRRAVELAEARYTQGLTDFQTVLDAQRSLFNLQDQLALSDRSVTTNAIALYKSLGGGVP